MHNAMINHATTWHTQCYELQWHTRCKMDLNQNGWASATPKSVAKDDESKTPKLMLAYTMQGPKPKGTKCNSTKALKGWNMAYNDTCSSSEMTYKMAPNHANNSHNACWKAQVPKLVKHITLEACKAMLKWQNQLQTDLKQPQNSGKMSQDGGLKGIRMKLNAKAHKWGIMMQLSNTLKAWQTWEYGQEINSEISCSMMLKHANISS